MKDLLKQVVFTLMLINIIACGETPTSLLNEPFPVIRPGPFGMGFSFIPNTVFQMGAPEDEYQRQDDESQHWVKLTKGFWIQTMELTISQWMKVTSKKPVYTNYGWCTGRSLGTSTDDLESNMPITCIEWETVTKFIDVLNERTSDEGYTYRLPTEAEWELAARTFAKNNYPRTYSEFKSARESQKDYAWCGGENRRNSFVNPHPVGELKPNSFGLYDTLGNVSEWVYDTYDAQYQKADKYEQAIVNPRVTGTASTRVRRGGSLAGDINYCRIAARRAFQQDLARHDTGFRLVRTVK